MKKLTLIIAAASLSLLSAQSMAADGKVVTMNELEYDTKLELALIENVQRQNLNPVEEALAYERLMGELKKNQKHKTL